MIHIDHREPPEMEQWFKEQNLDIELRRETLLVGDYIIEINDKIIPIERKTSDDYVGSLFLKHLNNQLFFLSQNFPESFLIVVGDFYEVLMSGGISRHALIASRVSCVLKRSNSGSRGRVNIIPLESDYDIPYCLYLLHNAIKEGDFTRHLSLQGKKSDDEWLFSMYAGLPGVGAEKAKSMVKIFPSLFSVVNATSKEIQNVDGIGKTLAEKIYKKIRIEVKKK